MFRLSGSLSKPLPAPWHCCPRRDATAQWPLFGPPPPLYAPAAPRSHFETAVAGALTALHPVQTPSRASFFPRGAPAAPRDHFAPGRGRLDRRRGWLGCGGACGSGGGPRPGQTPLTAAAVGVGLRRAPWGPPLLRCRRGEAGGDSGTGCERRRRGCLQRHPTRKEPARIVEFISWVLHRTAPTVTPWAFSRRFLNHQRSPDAS